MVAVRHSRNVGRLGFPANLFAASQSLPPRPGFGRAKSVILVFANGGQSQIDMWDPKPNAPLDVRGAFQPIATAVPGVQFCEHMPRIARVADRLHASSAACRTRTSTTARRRTWR